MQVTFLVAWLWMSAVLAHRRAPRIRGRERRTRSPANRRGDCRRRGALRAQLRVVPRRRQPRAVARDRRVRARWRGRSDRADHSRRRPRHPDAARFRRCATDAVWQLVAYIRSLSNAPAAAGGRRRRAMPRRGKPISTAKAAAPPATRSTRAAASSAPISRRPARARQRRCDTAILNPGSAARRRRRRRAARACRSIVGEDAGRPRDSRRAPQRGHVLRCT